MEAHRDRARKPVHWFVCSWCVDQFPHQQSQSLSVLFISSLLGEAGYSKYVEELEYRSCLFTSSDSNSYSSWLLSLLFTIIVISQISFSPSASHSHLQASSVGSWMTISRERLLFLERERLASSCLEFGKIFFSCSPSSLLLIFLFVCQIPSLDLLFNNPYFRGSLPKFHSLPSFSSSGSPLFFVFSCNPRSDSSIFEGFHFDRI